MVGKGGKGTDKREPGRVSRLVLGWCFIALALWLAAYSVYLLVTGRTGRDPQSAASLAVACIFLAIGGGTLLRSTKSTNGL